MMKEDEDEGFVYRHWIDSLRPQPPYRHMRYGEFSRQQRKVIEELLDRPHVEVMLAVEQKCGEPKFGFICYEWRGPILILHYIYLRDLYRRKRIATRLLQFAGARLGKTPIVASTWTKQISYYEDRWNIQFNYFLAWRRTDAHHTDLGDRQGAGGNVADDPKPPSGG